MPRFSIIVPIYNVSAYLRDCLDSISNQVCCDFECLLINDGSEDDSSGIAQLYCESDKKFKYHYKPNGGLSDARNFGLSHALGDYIVFVDSDDVVSPQLLARVNTAIDKYHSDIVYFDHSKFFAEDSCDLPVFSHEVDDSKFIQITCAELAQKPNFAWARVGRKELYYNNNFPVGYIYEDALTSPTLCATTKTVAYIKEELYGYRKRANSITTSSAERQFKLFETVVLLKNKVTTGQVPYEYYSTAFVNLIQSCLVSLVRIDDLQVRNKYKKSILEEYGKISVSDVLNSYSLKKFKILTLLSKNKFTLNILSFVLRPLVMFSDRKGR